MLGSIVSLHDVRSVLKRLCRRNLGPVWEVPRVWREPIRNLASPRPPGGEERAIGEDVFGVGVGPEEDCGEVNIARINKVRPEGEDCSISKGPTPTLGRWRSIAEQ